MLLLIERRQRMESTSREKRQSSSSASAHLLPKGVEAGDQRPRWAALEADPASSQARKGSGRTATVMGTSLKFLYASHIYLLQIIGLFL